MLALLLLRELIGIEFSKKTYLFLKECEGILMESIEFCIKKASIHDDKESNLTISILKTICEYGKIKEQEKNFEKLKNIYEFVAKNVRSSNRQIKFMGIEAFCNLILILDVTTLIQYKELFSGQVLILLNEVYDPVKEEDIKGDERCQIIEKPNEMKDLCMETIGNIVKKLDQSGNSDHNFLDPIIKNIAEKGWKRYTMAQELFLKVLQNFDNSQEIGALSVSAQHIYSTLLDYLSYSARNADGREESIGTIERILKILRTISKLHVIETVGLYYVDVFLYFI